MTFVYTLVFAVTCIEVLLLVLLLFPLSLTFQNRYCQLLKTVQRQLKIGLLILFSLVTILFVDSVNTAMKSNHPSQVQTTIVFDPYAHCKIFYAQRNAYLTLINLMLGFILYRIPQLICGQNVPNTQINLQAAITSQNNMAFSSSSSSAEVKVDS